MQANDRKRRAKKSDTKQKPNLHEKLFPQCLHCFRAHFSSMQYQALYANMINVRADRIFRMCVKTRM